MAKLTKRLVDSLAAEGGDLVVWDAELPGFGVRVKPSGVKSFCIQYRNEQGRSRRVTIGRYGRMTVDEARKEARQKLAKVDRGADPAQEKQAARTDITMKELSNRYMEEYALLHKKPLSVAADERSLRLVILPALGHLPVKGITRADVAKMMHAHKNEPVKANRAFALLSKALNLAETWGIRPDASNPCRHVKKFPERPKQRFLSEDELSRLGKVLKDCEQEGNELPSVITAIRLLLFTGCRRQEILELKWEYVDFERECIFFADSKTGFKAVPLGNAALEVLANTPRAAGNPYVCPGIKPMRPLVGLQRAWARIRTKAGLDDVRLHDLRHTFGATGAGAGQSLHILGKILGHSQAKTTSRYAHLAQTPQKKAVDSINDQLERAMNAPVKEKVVSIPTRQE